MVWLLYGALRIDLLVFATQDCAGVMHVVLLVGSSSFAILVTLADTVIADLAAGFMVDKRLRPNHGGVHSRALVVVILHLDVLVWVCTVYCLLVILIGLSFGYLLHASHHSQGSVHNALLQRLLLLLVSQVTERSLRLAIALTCNCLLSLF